MGHSVEAGTRRARGGMHYRPRKCRDDVRQQQEQDQAERKSRQAARDAEYRAAMRVAIGEKLPSILGNVTGHSHTVGLHLTGTGKPRVRLVDAGAGDGVSVPQARPAA